MNKSILFFGLLILVACTSESVEVTRVVTEETEITREVEVTRPVLMEVTREIETIQEVEVTREVMVEVEVTRIIEVEVTAVPTDTPMPAPTNTPAPTTPPSSDSSSSDATPPTTNANFEDTLLETLLTTRSSLQSFGGMIDTALRNGTISCLDVVNLYDAIAGAPTYDVSGESETAQYAYNTFREAITIFTTGASDMTQNCRDFLADTSGGTTIPFQQWGLARQEVNTALDTLHPAIQSLGGE